MKLSKKFISFLVLFSLLFTVSSLVYAQEKKPQLKIQLPKNNLVLKQKQEKEIGIVVTPKSIKTGVDCGMPEMCGLDPCLCGSSDAWGACSCNGTKDTFPTIKATVSDASLLKVKIQNGKLLVTGKKPGLAQVKITASLIHYQSVSKTVTVQVEARSRQNYLLAGPVVLLLAVCGFFFRRSKRTKTT